MTRSNLLTKIQIFALAVAANFATILVKAQDKAADLNVDVDLDKGGRCMIPAVDEFIKSIDMKAGRIDVALIEGMI